jgi:hypothetical protein
MEGIQGNVDTVDQSIDAIMQNYEVEHNMAKTKLVIRQLCNMCFEAGLKAAGAKHVEGS